MFINPQSRLPHQRIQNKIYQFLILSKTFIMIIDKIYLIYKKIHLNLLSPFILILLIINESLESLLLILLSILIHEIGHFIAIKLFSVKIENSPAVTVVGS